MSDATPPAAPAAEVTPASPAADPNAEVVQVSAKEWNELKSTVNRLSAATRVGKKPETPPAPTPNQNQEPLIPAKDPRVDQLFEKHSRSLRTAAFAQAINSVGVTGDDADLLQSAIEGKYGSRLKVNAETDEVYFEADDGSHRSVKDVTHEFFTKHGDRFKPARKGPSGDGMNGGTKGSASTAHPFEKLTYAEIQKHPNSKLRGSYALEHRAEYEAKRDAHSFEKK